MLPLQVADFRFVSHCAFVLFIISCVLRVPIAKDQLTSSHTYGFGDCLPECWPGSRVPLPSRSTCLLC
uniref:Secreted protein n=1 Tax=Ascaris lumbricoides TaxID=6252 RepID=A0A0M3IIR9_ASCLU